MRPSVSFPKYLSKYSGTAHRYYRTHFQFVLNLFKENNCDITFINPQVRNKSDSGILYCRIDDAKLLFDISDYHHLSVIPEDLDYDLILKFHYSPIAGQYDNRVFPFSPISFYDWQAYKTLASKISYRAVGLIRNNQRPHTQNRARRIRIQELLRANYSVELDSTLTSQTEFWLKVNEALLSVCVPGSRLDILDRGQLQYMAFGACTVSPPLSIMLPYGRQLIPDVHYLQCQTDCSDLIPMIEWAKGNRQKCIEIGNNAKHLFTTALTAEALFNWILTCALKVRR